MKKITKISFIILLYSFVTCQDYSLMDIYWDPEFPEKGDSITISADVSNSEFLKYSYQMNIHLSVDKKNYFTYPMSRDYSQGLYIWTYHYNINQDIHFQIDNNNGFNDITSNLIEVSNDDNTLQKANLLGAQEYLLIKDYTNCMFLLEKLIKAYPGQEIASKAKFMIAEIYLNDFKEYEIASTYYKNIIQNYPTSFNSVKKSIFTLGYIYANHLEYYTDAVNFYKKFKDIYPNDPLIQSIDYELDILLPITTTIDSLLNSSK